MCEWEGEGCHLVLSESISYFGSEDLAWGESLTRGALTPCFMAVRRSPGGVPTSAAHGIFLTEQNAGPQSHFPAVCLGEGLCLSPASRGWEAPRGGLQSTRGGTFRSTGGTEGTSGPVESFYEFI